MEKTKNEDFYLASAPIKKLLLKFSIPCVLAMLVSALYNIIDQIFIGLKLNDVGIYATTVVYPFTVIALGVALLIGDGCASLFSISLGKGDTKTGNKSVGNAILTSLISGVLLVIVGFALRDQILYLCGATPFCMDLAIEYYNIVLIGIPFFVVTNTLSAIIRADGSPKYAMIATLIGAVINLVFDPIMILWFDWGMTGAAVATILGQIVSAVVSLFYFRKTKIIKLSKESFKFDIKNIGKTLKLGFSSFITQFAIAAITVIANTIIRKINDPVLGVDGPGSALGVAFKIFGIVMAFCVGVSVGGQPIIGYNYGAKNYKRVLETYKQIIKINIIVGIVSTILFEACPVIFAKMFSISDLLIDFTCKAFRIYLGGILLCCIQKASCIFLQAINRPYKSMILSLMRDLVFLVPGVCLLGLLGNLELMLWAGLITDVLSFIFTIIFVVIECRKLFKKENNEVVTDISIVNNSISSYAITIDREFGSGGKYIAQELAKRLNLKCYDNEIVTRLANETNLDLSTLENIDEKEKDSFWFGFAKNGGVSSPEDSLFLAQSRVIENLYNEGPCVIVGRCSNIVLADKPNVINLFIYSSDIDFKVERKMKFENTTKEQTLKNIHEIDKYRANYFERFTGKKWGRRDNYELSIDTSIIGVENAINILESYIRQRIGLKNKEKAR